MPNRLPSLTVARAADTRSAQKQKRNPVVEIVIIVVAALVIAFVVQLFLVKTYRIPSGSMEPTLAVGQRVLVNRIGMRFGSPSVGDIVVFHPPKGADNSAQPICGNPTEGLGASRACSTPTPQRSGQTFIKRVVAVGGDQIQIRDGHVIRNGRREKDGYINPCGGAPGCTFAGTITVPDGSFFLMGDNRGESDDSRFWGPVPKKWIIGTTIATYWPPKRIGVF
jgi:signal peptidase I